MIGVFVTFRYGDNFDERSQRSSARLGSRRVMVLADVDSLDTLDRILLDLPIMKEHGQHVQVEVTPLRRSEDFATDLKKRLE